MAVRAKFRVKSLNHLETHDPKEVLVELSLYAVYGDGKGNESWSKYTPSGEITMRITNPAAIEQFSPGQDFYIDFTPA